MEQLTILWIKFLKEFRLLQSEILLNFMNIIHSNTCFFLFFSIMPYREKKINVPLAKHYFLPWLSRSCFSSSLFIRLRYPNTYTTVLHIYTIHMIAYNHNSYKQKTENSIIRVKIYVSHLIQKYYTAKKIYPESLKVATINDLPIYTQ